jgi:hypothetical protein
VLKHRKVTVDVIDHSISLFDRNPAVDLGGSGREHGKLHLWHIILLSNDRTHRQLLFGLFQISSWTKIPRVEIRSFDIRLVLDPVSPEPLQLCFDPSHQATARRRRPEGL